MSTGLMALLDDVTAMAERAVASKRDALPADQSGHIFADLNLRVIGLLAGISLFSKLIVAVPSYFLIDHYGYGWSETLLTVLFLGGIYLCHEAAYWIYFSLESGRGFPEHEAAGKGQRRVPGESRRTLVLRAISTDFVFSLLLTAMAWITLLDEPIIPIAPLPLALILGVAVTALLYGSLAFVLKSSRDSLKFAGYPNPIGRPGLAPGFLTFMMCVRVTVAIAMFGVSGPYLYTGYGYYDVDFMRDLATWIAAAVGSPYPDSYGLSVFGVIIGFSVIGAITGAVTVAVMNLLRRFSSRYRVFQGWKFRRPIQPN